MTTDTLPRPFGKYLLTAALGEDALGHEYRALRRPEDAFVRLRALDAPELSEDALLDAIEENGEVHEFLKNPAVARGVEVDAADGVPYIAWNEPNGRTLQSLLLKCRNPPRKIPVEHALLIAEKIATALDHAYNITIEGDRTLHGLVWPGFVAISDDGEIRLAGFGLAVGILPTLARPRLTREVAHYLAPEERDQQYIGKNSDVYSVGVILLELLTGRPPAADPSAVLRGVAGEPPPPILPEIQAVLRMTLGAPESRYGSTGDLRRELGKLLFSGPYSPSTFNLAYFLNDLFKDEIAAETRARTRESSSGPPPPAGRLAAVSSRTAPPAAAEPPATRKPAPGKTPAAPAAAAPRPTPKSRLPVAVVALLALLVVGGLFVLLSRRSPIRIGSMPGSRQTPPPPTATFLPELLETPALPTGSMSDAQFQDEVSRRLAVELSKLEAQMQSRKAGVRQKGPIQAATPSPLAEALARVLEPSVLPTAPPSRPADVPTPVTLTERAGQPSASSASAFPDTPSATAALPPPAPTRAVLREGSLIALEDADTPPRIAKIVKPIYPPFALRARIGGIVVLRVLVSERGAPIQVDVLRGAAGGLTDAAVDAVKRWTFDPARKGGLAMRTWMVVPIPFEP